jgi:hypothetical protein
MALGGKVRRKRRRGEKERGRRGEEERGRKGETN